MAPLLALMMHKVAPLIAIHNKTAMQKRKKLIKNHLFPSRHHRAPLVCGDQLVPVTLMGKIR